MSKSEKCISSTFLLLCVDDSTIRFKSILSKDGVPTIPKELGILVEEVCESFGLSVHTVGGNFEQVVFKLNDWITEDQAKDITNVLQKRIQSS